MDATPFHAWNHANFLINRSKLCENQAVFYNNQSESLENHAKSFIDTILYKPQILLYNIYLAYRT